MNPTVEPFGCAYSRFFESMQMVTGPSLMSETFMSAPKMPVFTSLPNCAESSAMNLLYKGTAISGFEARMYDGRLPFLVEANSVNWLTRSIPLSGTCIMELFMMPFSSSKIRRLTIFPQSHFMSSSVSVSSIPRSIIMPLPVSLMVLPSTFTLACRTRCITILMVSGYGKGV